MVKSAYSEDYPGLSFGAMLDNYRYFTSTEWREFTTSQGKEIVEFIGRYDTPKDSITIYNVENPTPQDVIIHKNSSGDYIVVRRALRGFVKIQFTIYKYEDSDGNSLEISFVGSKFDDEKKYPSSSKKKQWEIIDRISENKKLDNSCFL